MHAASGCVGVQEVLTAALAAEWTPKQALILERTENVESVVDAVQRVASQLPQVWLPSQRQAAHRARQHSWIEQQAEHQIWD